MIRKYSFVFRIRGTASHTFIEQTKTSPNSMQPRITEVLTYLDGQYETLRKAFESVPHEKRDKSPAPGAWSPAGIVEHLAVVETSIGRLISARVAAGREAGLPAETDHSSVMESYAIGELIGDRTRKIVSGERSHPVQQLAPDDAWQAFDAAHASLRSAVVDADGLALGEIVHPHPVFGPLNLYHWVAFVGGHEARHADQIREAASAA